jgi:phospholipase C
MKVAALVCLILLALTALAPAPALAQNPIPFQHIVLIIQQNRTPDNLFGAAPSTAHCGAAYPFETGVDIQDGGPDASLNGNNRCLVAQHLDTCWDIAHWHTTWNTQAHIDATASPPYAKMDGACGNNVFAEGQGCAAPIDCPPYSFVQKSDVQQYFDIATNYGFANYMFQTKEGPSFEAHQFLLGGTSAPTYPLDSNNYYL